MFLYDCGFFGRNITKVSVLLSGPYQEEYDVDLCRFWSFMITDCLGKVLFGRSFHSRITVHVLQPNTPKNITVVKQSWVGWLKTSLSEGRVWTMRKFRISQYYTQMTLKGAYYQV